jgi:hypothetical protein
MGLFDLLTLKILLLLKSKRLLEDFSEGYSKDFNHDMNLVILGSWVQVCGLGS